MWMPLVRGSLQRSLPSLAQDLPPVGQLAGRKRWTQKQGGGAPARGVCGGLAQFTGLDAWLWRLLFALLVILAGTGFLFYVLMWILVPQEPNTYHTPLPTNS